MEYSNNIFKYYYETQNNAIFLSTCSSQALSFCVNVLMPNVTVMYVESMTNKWPILQNYFKVRIGNVLEKKRVFSHKFCMYANCII